jgi:hypothetical protein
MNRPINNFNEENIDELLYGDSEENELLAKQQLHLME